MNNHTYEGDKDVLYMLFNSINKLNITRSLFDNTLVSVVADFIITNDKSINELKYEKEKIINDISNLKTDEVFTSYYKIKPYISDKYMYHINSGAFGITLRVNENFCFKIILKPINKQIQEYKIPFILYKKLQNTNVENFILLPYGILKDMELKSILYIIAMHNIIILIISYILDKNREKIDIFNTYLDFDKIDNKYKDIISSTNEDDVYKLYTYFYKKYFSNTFNIILINNYLSILKFMKLLKKDKNMQISLDSCIGSILILPLAISSSDELKLKKCDNEFIPDMINGKMAYEVNKYYFRHLILQIILLIIFSNKNETIFLHNDIKPNNILVFYNIHPIIINYKDKQIIFNEKYLFKLTDFDMAAIQGYENLRLKNSINEKYDNFITDIYYFFYRFKYDFFKHNLDKIDPLLNSEIENRFMNIIPKKEVTHKYHYIGKLKLSISDLDSFIFDSGLFNYWIKNN
ncbi:putative serine/threonine protein kinase [Alphaentomopoxvirus acuprea]|uniref:Serine/threonine-protein kinase 2 n=1 Tax=Alphaentomopoxvirus acuprea TaxID=62099 RepID=W6JIW0_9POXV|nr:putative serine/threonine protein kinase [Anomala cuprea entomopoxvirus]BAO49497.1 putative serine/threonine protein kinase [Anomala cuprea entomopoxvirus]